jgi:threonyl-tRNA synthetase
MLCRDPSAAVTIYHIGEPGSKEHWWDLCAGPHVPSTGAIDPDAVALERTAGAYWRGDEARAMLTRVYGTAWESGEQLAAYRTMQEEAARRDHRRLGQQLGLFTIEVRTRARPGALAVLAAVAGGGAGGMHCAARGFRGRLRQQRAACAGAV